MNSLFKKVVSFVSSGALLATMMLPGGMMASAIVVDPITLSKTATAKSGTTNQWDVALEVKGSNVTINPTADIVLVIDNSGSMDGSKLTNAKTAAENFTSSVLAGHPGAKIAVVSFSDTATTVCGLETNAADVNAKIGALYATDSTNIQAGIHAAEGILGGSTSTGKTKTIVLLTDGEPNYSYQGTAIDTTHGSWTDDNTTGKYNYYVTGFNYATSIGDGGDYSLWGDDYHIGTTHIANNGIGTVSEAQLAKNLGYTLYTVGYGVDSGSTAEKVLQAAATKNADNTVDYYSASVSSIVTVFNTILTAINLPVGTNGVVTDPIGSEYTFVGPTPLAPTQGTASYSAGTITWNLGSVDENTDATLTYTVQISADATPGQQYPTNGTTTLSYTDTNGGTQTQNFPIPQESINGYEVDYYYGGVQDTGATVTGTSQLGTAIPHSAKDKTGFTLEASNPVFSGDGTVTSDTTKNVITYNYAKNGETYTVKYHSPDGTVTTDPNGAAGAFGDAITPEATPTGEHISEVKVNGSDISSVGGTYTMTLGEGSNVMDVYYALNTETYTVNYYVLGSETTVPGLPASATTSGSGDFGTQVTITPPDITGYTYDSADNNPATLGEGEDGNVITIYYTKNIPVPPTPKSVDITIHYYLTGTTKSLKADKIDVGTAGKTKTETAPAISGYVALKASQTFTVQESDNVITFYYKKVANNNTPKGNPDTGDSGMSLPLAAAMTVLAAAGAAIIVKRKHAK